MLDNAHLTIRVVEDKPNHDVIYSLIEAPDGTVYVGLCGETGKDGCYAQILKYNKQEGTFTTLVDLANVIRHPADDIRPPHSKLHTTFCMAKDGKLLASTHMTAPPLHEDAYHYWHIYNDPDRCYLGSHLIIYDPKTNHAEDFGVVMPKGGARWMTYNPEREEVYMTSFLTCHFHVVNLKTGEIKDIGRISEHDWLGPCYCPADGRVYTTDSQGFFLRYTPETGTMEKLPLYTPRPPLSSNEACGIFNLVPGNDGTKLYGSVWNTMRTFELDPLYGKYGRIRDYGLLGIEEESPTEHPIGKRFPRMLTVGKDNKLYVAANDYITRLEPPHLYSIDIDSGEKCDLGILGAEGFPKFGGACSIAASHDGSIYFGGNPTFGGITAMYIYNPDGKNLPLPDGYDKYRNPPPAKPNKWVPPLYHRVTRQDNAVFVSRGTFVIHEEGRNGMYPVIPRGEGVISALFQDPVSGTVFGTTCGSKPHFFSFVSCVDLLRSMTTFGNDGDICPAMTQAEDGKLYFGTCNPDNPGGLYMYDVPACRTTYMEMANCDRGEFMEYCTIPRGKMSQVNDCHLNLASLGTQEGIYALTAKGGCLYGLTKPGGIFFIYNLETKELRSHHIFRSLIQEQPNLSKILFQYGDGIYFSGHHGYLIRYDIPSDSFQETGLKIPCSPGREYLNCLDALTTADDGLFYGGTHADGYLFRLNLKENSLVNLGKPTGEGQIRAVTIGKDGILWGIAGRDKDLSHLFAYNPSTGDLSDRGIMRSKIPNTWIIHRANTMLTGLDGELYIGEHDTISHLVTYFPPIGK